MYNSLSALPTAPYKIMTYLATSKDTEAENLWKIIKYPDYNALSQPNLTFKEKMDLVSKYGPQADYNIFLTSLIEDAIAESKCILKMYTYFVHPIQLYTANVVFAFDFLFGGKMATVELDGAPVARGDLFINSILTILNGVEVGGVGKLIFHEDMSRYALARNVIGNQKTFAGVTLYLSTVMGDSGREGTCER